ncbi:MULTISPECIES: Lrp/AsnC family transcriptional regulator [unclassified Undibacterium]|uniref:Lrp/AsnC family transcriptional regulator n=1 Tax=unclassified Undibacterium TaxID=2630295 RepID=UPI002AC89FBF|nr:MULTISPECIES: Lrp/AsnC family transcriptional regulator [unclassified Undibacterium]MEB0137438.1 Lrp/AsnC family transcriptional regulator [Undibacterium sp. CCC2.1]MEB0170897.1 Lrp/AsnC family transcriptional regulator [Undibacterium sp. CCC1.1]MEB0174849.1 Lrp/AsnC family transcriptional regulator [Undibacterium sp. CCC3.4]MEB0214185.1 Lrp/AsnC family transcriptional regulator [Undibacterium sp. 5I2]WPX44496.1 Lrp/AsnC family transcriptional regulator [Undibacterium sp. CCC3.4]
MNSKIDQFDRKILLLLQQDARISHAQIGRQVHLSQPAVSERIKRLEAAQVIRGYRADINPKALGYQMTAMIRLSTQQGRPYADYVAACPEIIDCYTVTGEDGAVMRVLATDVEHLQRIINELNAYGSTSTAIVLTTHVAGKPIAAPACLENV